MSSLSEMVSMGKMEIEKLLGNLIIDENPKSDFFFVNRVEKIRSIKELTLLLVSLVQIFVSELNLNLDLIDLQILTDSNLQTFQTNDMFWILLE